MIAISDIAIVSVFTLIPAVLLLRYFCTKDVNPEPIGLVVNTFCLGLVGVVLIVFLRLTCEPLLNTAIGSTAAWQVVIYAFMQIIFLLALPESVLKFGILVLYTLQHKEFDEKMDGIVYGAAASLGFAAGECMLFMQVSNFAEGVLFTMFSLPARGALGAIMGYYLGEAKFNKTKRRSNFFKALWIPIFCHALYAFPYYLHVRFVINPAAGDLTFRLVFFVSLLILTVIWWYGMLLVSTQEKNQKLKLKTLQ